VLLSHGPPPGSPLEGAGHTAPTSWLLDCVGFCKLETGLCKPGCGSDSGGGEPVTLELDKAGGAGVRGVGARAPPRLPEPRRQHGNPPADSHAAEPTRRRGPSEAWPLPGRTVVGALAERLLHNPGAHCELEGLPTGKPSQQGKGLGAPDS